MGYTSAASSPLSPSSSTHGAAGAVAAATVTETTVPFLLQHLERPLPTRSCTLASWLKSKHVPAVEVTQLLRMTPQPKQQPLQSSSRSLSSSNASSSRQGNDTWSTRVNRQELQVAYTAILSSYLIDPLREALASIPKALTPVLPLPQSSPLRQSQQVIDMPFSMVIERIATAGRFIQLLLEYQEPTSGHDTINDDMYNMEANGIRPVPAPPSSTTNPSQTGDAEICSMIGQVVRTMATVLCEMAKEIPVDGSVNDISATTTDQNADIVKVANELYKTVDCSRGGRGEGDVVPSTRRFLHLAFIMTFGTLQRLDVYCHSRPFVLSVLWKSLGELVELYKNDDQSPSKSQLLLPSELVQKAIASLVRHVQGGLCPLFCYINSLMAPTPTQLNAQMEDPILFLKIMGFILTKLTLLFKLPTAVTDDNDDDDLEPEVDGGDDDNEATSATLLSSRRTIEKDTTLTISTLLTLRGLVTMTESALLQQLNSNHGAAAVVVAATSNGSTTSVQSNSKQLQSYRTVATKVETVLLTWIHTHDKINQQSHANPVRSAILDSQPSSKSKYNGAASTERGLISRETASFHLGKTLVLTRCLAETVSDPLMDWSNHAQHDCTLLVVEELLLRSLPAAWVQWDSVLAPSARSENVESPMVGQLLLRTSLQTISDALLQIEIGMIVASRREEVPQALSRDCRLHRLLLHWLNDSASQHPLSRELVLMILQRRIIFGLRQQRLGDETRNGGGGVCRLFALTASLFLDQRTTQPLRMGLLSLLLRLLCDPLAKEPVRRILTEQLRAMVPLHFAKATTRKRKRPSPRNPVDDDYVLAVLAVMAKLDVTVGGDIETLASLDRGRRRPSCSSSSIQRAAFQVAGSNYSSGTNLLNLLDSFLKVWNPDRFEELHLVAVSVLLQLEKICSLDHNYRLSERELEATLRLIKSCTDMSLPDAKSCPDGTLQHPLFQAIRVLAVLGPSLQSSTPRQLLEQLVACYNKVLGSALWPVREQSLAALVQFAGAAPSCHEKVVRSCVPKPMKKVLAGRIHGTVCGETANLEVTKSQCHISLLSTLDPRRGRGQSVFPALSTLSIPMGSYYISMPTQAGRTAVVIFPPGEDSLSDMQYMLEGSDDDAAQRAIHVLKYAMMRPDGTCQIRLSTMD